MDDLHHKIKLINPAERIISLAPDLTEILFAIGAGNKVVGVMQGSDYPDSVKKIPVVASYNSINLEYIFLLHPDLIVAWQNGISENQLKQLQNFHIPIFLSNQKNLEDIPRTMKKLGCLVGNSEIANKKADAFLQRYERLKQTALFKKPVAVFYEMWSNPLLTVNKESWIHQIITVCGGKNIFAETLGSVPQVNIETVLLKNPDVIISTEETQWQQQWLKWPQLKATKNKKFISISPDLLERAGPRLIEGAEEMCKKM